MKTVEVALACSIAIGASTCAQIPSNGNGISRPVDRAPKSVGETNQVAKSVTVEGVELSVSLPKEVSPERGAFLQVKVTNHRRDEIRGYFRRMGFDVDVTTAEGKRESLKKGGGAVLLSTKNAGTSVEEATMERNRAGSLWALVPQQIATQAYDLRRAFQLGPGRHRLAISTRFRDAQTDVWKTLAIRDLEFQVQPVQQ